MSCLDPVHIQPQMYVIVQYQEYVKPRGGDIISECKETLANQVLEEKRKRLINNNNNKGAVQAGVLCGVTMKSGYFSTNDAVKLVKCKKMPNDASRPQSWQSRIFIQTNVKRPARKIQTSTILVLCDIYPLLPRR